MQQKYSLWKMQQQHHSRVSTYQNKHFYRTCQLSPELDRWQQELRILCKEATNNPLEQVLTNATLSRVCLKTGIPKPLNLVLHTCISHNPKVKLQETSAKVWSCAHSAGCSGSKEENDRFRWGRSVEVQCIHQCIKKEGKVERVQFRKEGFMLPGQIKPSLSFRKLLGFLKNPDNYTAPGTKTLCW